MLAGLRLATAPGQEVTLVSFLFGCVQGERACDVGAFFEALPRLSRGAVVDCDIGNHSSLEICACVCRLRGAPSPQVISRLSFWAWKLGGAMSSTTSPESALDTCDTVVRHVAPSSLGNAMRSLLLSGSGGTTDPERRRLSFPVDLASPDSAGIRFERSGGAMFVPSPRSPPIGDELRILLRVPGHEERRVTGTVTALRSAGERGSGTPAGFVVKLHSVEAAEMLDARAGTGLGPNQRRAPRYPVCTRARVSLVEGGDAGGAASSRPVARLSYNGWRTFAEDYIENLSQGGAFIRTGQQLPIGTAIRLEIELPDGALLTAPSSVVFRNERGLGVRFELDSAGEGVIADAVLKFTDHRPRALVVDDDALRRRMVGDALSKTGFEVFTAADGASGLHVLLDHLLELQVLVTDLCMPELSGEELIDVIRGPGGEEDLAIVVNCGSLDEGQERRLLEAGADAVVTKASGLEALSQAAVRAVLRRRLDGSAPGARRVSTGSERPTRAGVA
jgi:CheY-like chemotaxis protein